MSYTPWDILNVFFSITTNNYFLTLFKTQIYYFHLGGGLNSPYYSVPIFLFNLPNIFYNFLIIPLEALHHFS